MAIEDDFAHLTPAQKKMALEGPALIPPPGVLPNLIDPPNENALGFSLFGISTFICTLLVAIRLYAKIVRLKKMDIEDYLVVAALGVYAGFLYISYEILVMPGLYVHQWNVKLKYLSDILYKVNTNYILYGNIIMLLKAGILLEWTHLFVPLGNRNTFWWICHVTLWANVMFYVACTIVENFSCSPREKIWNKMLTEGHCINNQAVIVSSGIINLGSDFLILALPQQIIWGLKISTRKRVGVCLIFATGVFGCVCGAFRLVSSIRALKADDITFYVGPIGLWSLGEVTAGFLVLCVPSIPKVFRDSALVRAVNSLVKRISRSKSIETVNSRRGLPSWYRTKIPGKLQHTDYSDLDDGTVISVCSDDTTKSTVERKEKPMSVVVQTAIVYPGTAR